MLIKFTISHVSYLGPVYENGAGDVGVQVVLAETLVGRAEEVRPLVALRDHLAADVHQRNLQRAQGRYDMYR